jgi:trimeric autotransporter adhesin
MKRIQTPTLWLGLALACVSTLNFQLSASPLGTAFHYQGKLADGASAANGSYDLKFTLYDALSGGSLVAGPLTNSPVAVTNGCFTVPLDFGSVFDGNARWLEIGVRTNGSATFTTLSPRQPLTPAPYALYASNTATVGGQAPSAFAPASGSTAYVTKSGDTMTGSLNLPANGLTAGGNQLALSGGKVGVGTASPQYQLTVSDRAYVRGLSDSAYGLLFRGNSIETPDRAVNTDEVAINYYGYNSGNSAFRNFAVYNGKGGNVLFARGSDGNVGIGTANPASKLDVAGTVALSGNLNLPATTSTAGAIYSSGTRLMHTYGSGNFFAGPDAGNLTISGAYNTGIGYLALGSDSIGYQNTANGSEALRYNTSGYGNTASGYRALYGNANGSENTAVGTETLYENSSGMGNAAVGSTALFHNTSGSQNTAVGVSALYANTTGSGNCANGLQSLYSNTDGYDNTASGNEALYSNTNGHGNTANGHEALYSNTSGYYNTAIGAFALYHNATGQRNTAIGVSALSGNTTGSGNTAIGDEALVFANSAGPNTAIGSSALGNNTSGSNNTAVGYTALVCNTNGNGNTAVGDSALYLNRNGDGNTAVGNKVLYLNSSGDANTAVGDMSLYYNQNGSYNTANGYQALIWNRTGQNNTALGAGALYFNTNGNFNTAIGDDSLVGNTSGSNNIAIGYLAGNNLTTGNNNIHIGHQGVAGESNTIHIGTSNGQGNNVQTATYIAGIWAATPPGDTVRVLVNSAGRLGVETSSQRFKEAIEDMGSRSDAVLSLRPVSFRYKPDTDPQGVAQFGLIAEEVEQVAPELVVRDQEGKPYTVRYDQVNAMLLNEFLKEHHRVEQQGVEIYNLQQRLDELERLVIQKNGGTQ